MIPSAQKNKTEGTNKARLTKITSIRLFLTKKKREPKTVTIKTVKMTPDKNISTSLINSPMRLGWISVPYLPVRLSFR